MTQQDKRGFFSRLFHRKKTPHAEPAMPGYLEYMAHSHTEDSKKDLNEFIRRRSMDERRSMDSTPRQSENDET